jgi:hypothetical protein
MSGQGHIPAGVREIHQQIEAPLPQCVLTLRERREAPLHAVLMKDARICTHGAVAHLSRRTH